MVMHVGQILPITFRAKSPENNTKKTVSPVFDKVQSNELANITNTALNIKTPIKYSKIDEIKLDNGLEIHSYKLSNGHRVTIVPMKNSPAIVKNYVNVGSMNETDDIKGISHFLEHMAFNGTNGENGHVKLVHGDSFSKIDALGGWTNASTNYAITDYVNSTPLLEDSDIEEQIRILAAMTEDLALPYNMIEKEKNPVSSEINMILDNPQTIAFDQTVRTLFNIRSSADDLIGGSVKHIQNMDYEKVKNYYDKYYTPDNMNLVITGNINPEEVIKLVSKHFNSTKVTNGQKYETKLQPIQTSVRKDFISNKATSAEIVFGFCGPKNNDTKSDIIGEIIQKYLNSTELGLKDELEDLNAYGIFSGEKIVTSKNAPTMLIYASSSTEKNSQTVIETIYNKLSSLEPPSEKTLANIKDSLRQEFNDSLEYSMTVNEIIGRDVLLGDINYLKDYNKILDSITSKDVEKYIKDYLNTDKTALTVIHPKKAVNEVSFRGKKRMPVNMETVSQTTLDNNYKLGFQDTINENISYEIKLSFDIPNNVNPAAWSILNLIYSMGTDTISEKIFNKFKEDKNISINTSLTKNSLTINGYSGAKNYELSAAAARELLHKPRITDENINKAIFIINDELSRKVDTAYSLYDEYESQFNQLYHSTAAIEEGLKTITKEDIINLHNYILNNSVGTIAVNSPISNTEFKEKAENLFGSFNCVNPYTYKQTQTYSENKAPVLLTKARDISQADIMETYKFPAKEDIKSRAVYIIMNTILSSSNSIGLFNSLREKEHLAYTVRSSFDKVGDCGTIDLKILTTTDNKETGEQSFENLEKSIEGFHRQLKLLIEGQFTNEDLESAKRILKASLLDKEGTYSKISTISNGLNSKEGIEIQNKIYLIIDSITNEDITNCANEIFSKHPIYSIVASQDTLDANGKYLQKLIKNTDSV